MALPFVGTELGVDLFVVVFCSGFFVELVLFLFISFKFSFLNLLSNFYGKCLLIFSFKKKFCLNIGYLLFIYILMAIVAPGIISRGLVTY